MKKLVLLLTLLSTSVFASNVSFSIETDDNSARVKNYIVDTLEKNCPQALNEENNVIVTNIEIDRIDQGMELEYKAFVKVIEDYGHSPAKEIIIEFDEEVYHAQGFYLFKITKSHDYLCK